MKTKQLAIDLLHFTASLIPGYLLPRLVRREVISIFYHAVSDGPIAHVRHLYPVVPVDAFREALDFMQKRFNFITYDQLQAHYDEKTPLPTDALHLSFDDGFTECYHVVRPILLQRGIPCTFFLTLDWLDNRMLYFRHTISLFVARIKELGVSELAEILQQVNRRFGLSLNNLDDFVDWITAFREPEEEVLEEIENLLGVDPEAYRIKHQPYLTTPQIQEMRNEGFTIGAHGLSHRKLGFIPKKDVEMEITASCQAIQLITGQGVVPFSFPQSAGNVDRAQLANIRDRHPLVGLMFDTKDLRQDVPFIINRIWAERPLTPERKLHPLAKIINNAYRDAWTDGVLGKIRSRR